MRVAQALRELFGDVTQSSVAEKLTACGMPTEQTKVSAWLRGRVPDIEQMNTIEECYGKPRGWIYARSGFVDHRALVEVGVTPRAAEIAAYKAEIRQTDAEIETLRSRRRGRTPRAGG